MNTWLMQTELENKLKRFKKIHETIERDQTSLESRFFKMNAFLDQLNQLRANKWFSKHEFFSASLHAKFKDCLTEL